MFPRLAGSKGECEMRTAQIAAVLLVFLSATMAGAKEKQKTDHSVVVLAAVGYAEMEGGQKWPFNTVDPRQWLPPIREGTVLRFRLHPVPTTLDKPLMLNVQVGLQVYENYQVGQVAPGVIEYTPKIGEDPGITIWSVMDKAHVSKSDIVFGIGTRTQKAGDHQVGYQPIWVISSSQWTQYKAQLESCSNEEEVAAAEAHKAEVEVQNAKIKAEYEQKLAQYRQDLAVWERTPKTKTILGTPGSVKVMIAVVRFMEGEHLSSYSGRWAIVRGNEVVAEGQAREGQASFGWWESGAEVVVRYGQGLQCATSSFRLDDDGVIEVTWAPQRRPDQARRVISKSDVLAILCGGRKAGADGVLRALGTDADEIESAIRTGRGEVRPTCPGEHFILATGQPAQTSSWAPSSEQPAFWVTLQNGQAYALQVVDACGNFVAARYLPPSVLLRPEIERTEALPDREEAVLVSRPEPPTEPDYLSPVVVPKRVYHFGNLPGMAMITGKADVMVRAQPLDLDWLVWGLVAYVARPRMTQNQWQGQQCGGTNSPNCPTGDGYGPYTPPGAGWPFDATIQTPGGQERGGYGTGTDNAPPAQ